ncbi:MAG TPA: hypothetical protein VI790_06140 [Candidatus Nanoarchaeia archaeon]|nr:hypothetical protein [Candidatus Nanoarchaeia archaeon]
MNDLYNSTIDASFRNNDDLNNYFIAKRGHVEITLNVLPKSDANSTIQYATGFWAKDKKKIALSLESAGKKDLAKIVKDDVMGISYFYLLGEDIWNSTDDQKDLLKALGLNGDLNKAQEDFLTRITLGAPLFEVDNPFQSGGKQPMKSIIYSSIKSDNNSLSLEDRKSLEDKIGEAEGLKVGPYIDRPSSPEIHM